MKRIVLTSLVLMSVLAFSDCSKKSSSGKDTVTQLLLAAGGNSGSGNSCIKGSTCVEVLGYPPAGFDFSTWCSTQSTSSTKATVTAGTCSSLGYKTCTQLAQALATFQTCTK